VDVYRPFRVNSVERVTPREFEQLLSCKSATGISRERSKAIKFTRLQFQNAAPRGYFATSEVEPERSHVQDIRFTSHGDQGTRVIY
jgi:hypothetical protein